MRSILFAAAALSRLPLTQAVAANKGADTIKACGSAWTAMSNADKAKTTYKSYSTDCMKHGGPAAAPAASAAPAKCGHPDVAAPEVYDDETEIRFRECGHTAPVLVFFKAGGE